MLIGILIPTRGLIFTRGMEAIERERVGKDVKVYFSHDLPIPDGHNQLAKQALEDGCDKLLFIEEDVVIPAGTLEQLLRDDVNDITCMDYGVSGWSCILKNTRSAILWCGLGCTIINRIVFEKMAYPYFRADMTLSIEVDETGIIKRLGEWKQLPEEYIKTKQYGSLDIWFCLSARKLGFTIGQIEGEAEHLELIELGKRETNNGLHTIRMKPKITRHQSILEGGETL